jgi:DNA-directed RNA polymerase subunit RPC12/RpoP
MKAQCERCKEIVAFEFALGEGGVEVRCPGCGARYFVAATAGAAATTGSGKSEPGTGSGKPEAGNGGTGSGGTGTGFRCPKCSEAQPEGTACRRCGLVFARWTAASAEPVGLGRDDQQTAALFAACEAAWQDAGGHERFIAVCQQTGALGYAAGRYRAALARRGGVDAVATERLQQIRTLAEAALARAAPVAGAAAAAPYKNLKALMLIIFLLLACGLVWALFFRPTPRRKSDESAPAPIVPLPTAPNQTRTPAPAPHPPGR